MSTAGETAARHERSTWKLAEWNPKQNLIPADRGASLEPIPMRGRGLKGICMQHHSRKTRYQPVHTFYGVMLHAYLSLRLVGGVREVSSEASCIFYLYTDHVAAAPRVAPLTSSDEDHVLQQCVSAPHTLQSSPAALKNGSPAPWLLG